ncbi:MAG: hypothetical protein RR855_13050 [Comamonas sp.]
MSKRSPVSTAAAALSCTAAVTAVALACFWPSLPAHSSASPGPILAQAQQQGVLKLALRSYSRPSLPHDPLPPEPDVLDQALAQWLGRQLGVRVQLTSVQQADIALQGMRFENATPQTANSYAEPGLQLVSLKQQAARWRSFAPGYWQLFEPAARKTTAGPSVCMGQGLASAQSLLARGLQPQIAPSSIHAISDFLAGRCDLLADTPAVITRLLTQPSWRFYARLGQHFAPDAQADITLRSKDEQSAQWLQQSLRQWRASGQQQQAFNNRVSTIALEASLLEDGAICH